MNIASHALTHIGIMGKALKVDEENTSYYMIHATHLTNTAGRYGLLAQRGS